MNHRRLHFSFPGRVVTFPCNKSKRDSAQVGRVKKSGPSHTHPPPRTVSKGTYHPASTIRSDDMGVQTWDAGLRAGCGALEIRGDGAGLRKARRRAGVSCLCLLRLTRMWACNSKYSRVGPWVVFSVLIWC
jgi:hypothetical protein